MIKALLSLLIALAAGLAPLTAAAQWRDLDPDWRRFESDFDEGRKTWKEIEAKLPPYPREENLLPFEAGGTNRHTLLVDAPSISAGEDGVVRYTLVVKTAGGAVNVSFEGIRCETREQKYYAIGRAGGVWSRARDPQWRRIDVASEVNRHHAVLHADYLCVDRLRVRAPREAIYLLKQARYRPVGTGS